MRLDGQSTCRTRDTNHPPDQHLHHGAPKPRQCNPSNAEAPTREPSAFAHANRSTQPSQSPSTPVPIRSHRHTKPSLSSPWTGLPMHVYVSSKKRNTVEAGGGTSRCSAWNMRGRLLVSPCSALWCVALLNLTAANLLVLVECGVGSEIRGRPRCQHARVRPPFGRLERGAERDGFLVWVISREALLFDALLFSPGIASWVKRDVCWPIVGEDGYVGRWRCVMAPRFEMRVIADQSLLAHTCPTRKHYLSQGDIVGSGTNGFCHGAIMESRTGGSRRCRAQAGEPPEKSHPIALQKFHTRRTS